MAKAASPPRFNRGHFYDPNFTAEITAKMQVPKRIKVTGFNDDEDFDIAPKIPFQEKFDMRVPERILVTGELQNEAYDSIDFILETYLFLVSQVKMDTLELLLLPENLLWRTPLCLLIQD